MINAMHKFDRETKTFEIPKPSCYTGDTTSPNTLRLSMHLQQEVIETHNRTRDKTKLDRKLLQNIMCTEFLAIIV